MVNLASLWKPEACGPTVLPDRSILISQKLLEDIWGYFSKQFKQGDILFLLENAKIMCASSSRYGATAIWVGSFDNLL